MGLMGWGRSVGLWVCGIVGASAMMARINASELASKPQHNSRPPANNNTFFSFFLSKMAAGFCPANPEN